MDENIAFEEIIKKTDRLPTLPGIAFKLIDAVRQEDPDLDEITKIISSDPPLSAEILKCINSPFYSLESKVTSVNHAVNMMGIKTVKNLALSFSLVKNFEPQGPFIFINAIKNIASKPATPFIRPKAHHIKKRLPDLGIARV